MIWNFILNLFGKLDEKDGKIELLKEKLKQKESLT
jgi:hypothetical protein